jgi:predicted CoA-binding protein
MKQRVAILGASHKPERYAHKAFKMLQQHGHEVLPVNPGLTEIEKVRVFSKLTDISGPIDTLTLYVNPQILEKNMDDILSLKPGRVIFNPGSESKELEERLQAAGIKTEQACTLVLLRTNQFES